MTPLQILSASSTPDPRPALRRFAGLMEIKLRKNDHKTGWRELPPEALLKKLEIELEEFRVAYQYESRAEAVMELVDIANFAMMLADRIEQDMTKAQDDV